MEQEQLTEVHPGFFVSNLKSARKLELLQQHQITHVINLTAHKYENAFPEQFTYLSLGMRDNLSCDMNYYIYSALEFIETYS